MNIVVFRQKSVFLVGFAIGFVAVILSVYIEDLWRSTQFCNSNSKKTFDTESEEIPIKGNLNYDTWRASLQVRVSELDADSYNYGSQSHGAKVTLESDWLASKVPVTCVVFVEKLKLAVSIQATWGERCNQLLFFSQHLSEPIIPVINLGIKYTSSWQLLCEAMNYVWKNSDTNLLSWVIFVKDDTVVVTENLRYLVAPLNSEEPHYLGHAVVLWGQAYNVAQAGFVLSRESLRRVVKKFDTSGKCTSGGKYWKKEDYYLGK